MLRQGCTYNQIEAETVDSDDLQGETLSQLRDRRLQTGIGTAGQMTRQGILVISHGSRDPAWVKLVDEAVSALALPAQIPVESAFLELVEAFDPGWDRPSGSVGRHGDRGHPAFYFLRQHSRP